ncbi:MAG: hypothetical protein KGP28_08385 [Bdellovibrionales bacterium]|nr:hypothetical protein [Bdellovibrionales bacterium]
MNFRRGAQWWASVFSLLLLSSCIQKTMESVLPGCHSASSGTMTYYSSFAECSSLTGSNDCTPVVIVAQDQARSCFFSPSSVGSSQSLPSLSFIQGLIDAGIVNANSSRVFYVKNTGSTPATSCVATFASGSSPQFSIASNIPFTVAPNILTPITVNLNHVPNSGAQSGSFSISCDSNISLSGGTITAEFSDSSDNSAGQGASLSLSQSTAYTIPSMTTTQIVNYQHPVTLRNTGSAPAGGCTATLVEEGNTNAPVTQGMTLVGGMNFSIPAITGTKQLFIQATWSGTQRTAKIRVLCSSGNVDFVSPGVFTFLAGQYLPEITFSFQSYSMPSFFASGSQALTGSIINPTPAGASNCSLSLVDHATNLPPAPAGIFLSYPNSTFSLSASGGQASVALSASWASVERKFKIKALCGNSSWLSAGFTVAAGTPSPFLEIVPPLPNHSVPAFLPNSGTQTRTITYKNNGNEPGANCSAYLVSNTQAEEINQNNYPGITLADTSSFNLAVGATITKTINIAWNSNPRSFKVKANCNNSNWRVSEAFNVAAGTNPPNLSFNPNNHTTTDPSETISVTNASPFPATGCNASIWETCDSAGSCSNPPDHISLVNSHGQNFSIPANSSLPFTLVNPSIFPETVKIRIICSQTTIVSGTYTHL